MATPTEDIVELAYEVCHLEVPVLLEDKAYQAEPREIRAGSGRLDFRSRGIKQTGNPVSPAFYIMALALVSGVAMLMTRDRTNIDLDDER